MNHETRPIGGAIPAGRRRSGWGLRLLFAGVGLALLATASVVVWLVADTALSVLGGSAAAEPRPPLTQYVTAGQADAAEPDADPDSGPNVWDQHGPVNILLLGLDEDDCAAPTKGTARRTDTIILVRVDPQTRRAAMLSIPRDLYVFIPGYGAKKVNTAHVLGSDPDDPHAGPALLARVLRDNLELSAQRYVRIDFEAFQRVIDEGLGGLEMDLPPSPDDPTVSLYDTEYPDGHCGVMTIRFEPGRQRLSGDEVLQYARSRYSTSDFDRSRRQMEVLVAMKEQAAKASILPRLPKLLPAVLQTVDTDLTTSEIVSLARVARGVQREDIVSLRMDEGVVYPDMLTIDGVPQAVLRHNQAAFDEVRRQFLDLATPTPTPAPTEVEVGPTPSS